MQSLYGLQNFNFVPETYVLPGDTRELENIMIDRPDVVWIVKPAGKSQGKGIFLTSDPADLPVGQNFVACRYIDNPLLINNLKFDLRIYVALTCVDPLRIYIYKEGLVRFATSNYSTGHISNRFAHLTNYSVNKNNPNFDSSTEDGKGHKWTLSAFKKFCQESGINFSFIWQKIKEIVIKTILSAESKIYAGFKMHVPYRNNCFELLGFDILIDENLTPWLLEVNLSPSLNTDSNLDLKVKSVLISDLFTLAGISSRIPSKDKKSKKAKPEWNSSTLTQPELEINKDDLRVIQETRTEAKRAGNFERIFPGEYSFLFSRFFEEQRPANLIVCGEYEKAKRTPSRSTEKGFKGNAYRARLVPFDSRKKPNSAIYLKMVEEGLNKLFR
jgi:tubulin polyglutamylase TTLL5